MLQTRRGAIDGYRLPAGPTAANPSHGLQRSIDWTDRQTDGRAPDRYIAPAPYTMSVGNLAAGRVAIVELVVEQSNVVVVIIVVVVVVVVVV